MNDSDFIANLKFKSTEEGGRVGYASSGYRPHVEFDNYPEYLTSGSQTFLNKEKVFPGESAIAKIQIVGKEYFAKRLYIGKKFKFCEGSRTKGTGEITEVVNKSLEKNPNEKESEFNVNLYPDDIVIRLKKDFFGVQYHKAVFAIQDFLLNHRESRSPRMVRSLIHLSERKIEYLQKQIEIAKIDVRDVLFAAEYENINSKNPIRLRDFSKEFGNEKL